MDDAKCDTKSPLEVRREFSNSSRLEAQVLMTTYELIVPVIRQPASTPLTLWDLIEQSNTSPSSGMAQGA